MMHPRVIDVEPRPGYRLWLRFEDGRTGEIDLSDLVGVGVFRRWEDEGAFRAVYVDSETGTIAWHGGIDLDPDVLYQETVRPSQ